MSFNINMTAGYTFIFVIVYIIIIFTFYPTKLIYEDQASVPDDHLHQINDLITTVNIICVCINLIMLVFVFLLFLFDQLIFA